MGKLTSELSKPLTAEEKAAKEREDKAKALCKLRCDCFEIADKFDWESLGENYKEMYRKMIDAGVKLPR